MADRNELTKAEKDRLLKIMSGRTFICIHIGADGKGYCNLNEALCADHSMAASILRECADLLEGKHKDRIRIVGEVYNA
jgi:hypothetical protein